MKAAPCLAAKAIAAFASFLAWSADEKPRGEGKRGGQHPQDAPLDDVRFIFKTEVPAHPLDVVLGRPTKCSMTASVLAYADREAIIQYGPQTGAGNTTKDAHAGLLEDDCAWEWGDALFVVLDPFWFTQRQRGSSDNWSSTPGREQYDWLAATLAKSRARFRFVLLHHLVGGIGKDARGGSEAASLYEWGGHEPDGADVVKTMRPGWPMPSHELLLKNQVNIVFHGHDHLFVKQDLDGIVYQEVPRPGHPRYDNTRSADEYGDKSGTLLGSSGHRRVKIEAAKATVEYIRAFLPADETSTRQNASVATRDEVRPK
jgi:hypothetical protein